MESARDQAKMETQLSDLNISNKPPTPLTHLPRIPKSIGKSTIKADKSYIALLEDGRPRRNRKRNEGRRLKWWYTRQKALMHHPGGFVEDGGLATKMTLYYKALKDMDEEETLPSHTTDGEQGKDGFAVHPDERELRGTAAWQLFDETLARYRVADSLSTQFESSLDLTGEVSQSAT
ncbi:hypothetical protein BHE90_011497 [Fusarium euwallaceae]|uniref:Uncharacterized protein n=3 Tax=Fusarium solani species complex TaxID=232080 RepID=A0A3M2SDI8_9HYPO|nr:hypothetical protein CDV36_005047 [Fusarium kuroshium]RTE74084.1 hypothetical protein BHE90_011497 [Fusarium euwallaceae]